MTAVDTIAQILAGNLPYQTYVETGRHRQLAEQIAADSKLVDRDEHNAAVKKELDWQYHWCSKFEKADLEAGRLRRLLDITTLERVGAIVKLVNHEALRPSKSAKHDDSCWQRHAGCLARRISDLLEDDRYDSPEARGAA